MALLDCILTVLTSLAVVAVIRVVGLILVIALFTIPSALTENNSRSLGSMMASSTSAAGFFCLAGLWLSVKFDVTAGAAIVLVAAACCSAAFAIKSLR